MKSSLPVLAMALAALGVFARPGLSQQYMPPGGYGQPVAGFEPTHMTAASPYAASPYAAATYGPSFGVQPVGYRQPIPGQEGAMPPGVMPPSVMPPNVMPGGPAPAYGPAPGAMQSPSHYEGEYYGDGQQEQAPGIFDSDYGHDEGFIDGECESCGGDGCDYCGMNPRVWGGFMYFLNWRDDRTLPPLVTSSPTGTAIGPAGLLPDATVLVGGDVGNQDARSGGKLFGGIWLDELHEIALGGDMWAVGSDPVSFFFGSDGSAGSLIIAQPFESTLTGTQTRAIVAYPGFSSGSVRVSSKQYNTFGGDFFVQTNWNRTPGMSIDLLAGYVMARMDDLLTINADRTSIAPDGPPPFGSTLNFNEFFRTQNEFHGGELGITTQLKSLDNRWSFNLTGKCGFGGMTQRLRIRGATVTTVGGQQLLTAGGLYTQPTNIGDYEQTKFAVAPEVEARMSYWMSPNIGITFGYQFYYWSNVALAGDQVDTTINPTQFGGGALVGEPRPRAIFNNSDFWLQGMNVGIVGQF